MRSALGVLSLIWKLYIAIVLCVTAILYYPIIFPLLLKESRKKKAFRVFVVWSWTIRIFCCYFVVKKKDHEIPNEPYIIIANHSSYLDIFLMYSIMPKQPFIFFGKSEILGYPIIKTYFKRLNIPIYRSNNIKAAKALILGAKEVKKGWSLVIFPEGGIPEKGIPKMLEFKEGAFQLAKRLEVPIVPMTFTNNYKLFSDPMNILGPARPGVSHVHIHPFLSKEEIMSLSKIELKQKCFNIINGPILESHPDL